MAKLGRHHVPGLKLAYFSGELLASIACAAVGALTAQQKATSSLLFGGVLASAVLASGVLHFALYLADLYDPRTTVADFRRGERILRALGGAALAVAPFTVVLPSHLRLTMTASFIAAIAGIAAFRAAVPMASLRRRVLIAGHGAQAELVARELDRDGEHTIVGVADPGRADLCWQARQAKVAAVVVACDDRRGIPSQGLLRCRLAGVEVADAPVYVEKHCRRLPVELLSPATLIYQEGFTDSAVSAVTRRLLSACTAFALLVVSTPLLLLIFVLIRTGSPGPALYRQERVGKDGRQFTMLKFRTMREDAERGGARWAASSDPRVTRVGAWLRRCRLDELPQLLNILAGDMNLVGPRPERPEFVSMLAEAVPYYQLRHLVRPGLTGWAQIRYPYGSSVEDAKRKLAFDLYYIKRASLLLDVVILFHTVRVVLTGRGAR
ncbi:MAG: exopolysaccharide biosynthesis polyprenyl glycosylphosphotransferase [Pseudomonadota bacterium]